MNVINLFFFYNEIVLSLLCPLKEQVVYVYSFCVDFNPLPITLILCEQVLHTERVDNTVYFQNPIHVPVARVMVAVINCAL